MSDQPPAQVEVAAERAPQTAQDEAAPAAERQKTVDSGLYQALVRHYLHQNQLSWSCVQFMALLQGGAITAGYTLRETFLSLIALVFGIFGSLILWYLSWGFRTDRDVNYKLMDEVSKLLMNDLSLQNNVKGSEVRLRRPETGHWTDFRARHIFTIFFLGFILLDGLLIVLFRVCPQVLAGFCDFLRLTLPDELSQNECAKSVSRYCSF